MRFYCFHLMPWAHLPEDFAQHYDSAWVTCPNTLYDPQLGHPLYNRYLDELELADQLGFEGICVNEHHQNAYGNMPSPNIIAACLARRTQQAKLVILGNVLPLYDHPQRVAEELAMLDVITQGRIISGMVVGTGMEYFSYNVNPTYARERFHEAHDLILKAWTTDGPFAWEGKHYRFRYINLWPKPYQKPHPPIWIPGSGSPETMEWVAQQRYTYMVLPTLAPFELRRESAERFRTYCEAAGYTARYEQIGWGIGIYVAETDAQARREYEPHFWYYARNLLRTPAPLSLPPGHTSLPTMVSMAERRLRSRPGGLSTWEEVERGGYVVVGSPETVRQKLEDYARRVGFGVLVANFSVGNVPSELVCKSMTLFAQEVMPKLRHVNADVPLTATMAGASA
jgi:alkanesulfonate monooxygenase SsuD/methylene tetrahydromethanopterin reductase-like flavin-dependent oxidoreductase (luciferase family)